MALEQKRLGTTALEQIKRSEYEWVVFVSNCKLHQRRHLRGWGGHRSLPRKKKKRKKKKKKKEKKKNEKEKR